MTPPTVITILPNRIQVGHAELAPPDIDANLFTNEKRLMAFVDQLRGTVPKSEVRDRRHERPVHAEPVLCWCHDHKAYFTTGRPEEMWGESWNKPGDLPYPPNEWGGSDRRDPFRLAHFEFSGGQCAWEQVSEHPDQFGFHEVLPRVPHVSINHSQWPSRPWLVIGEVKLWRGALITRFVQTLYEQGGRVHWESAVESALWAFPPEFLLDLRGRLSEGVPDWRQKMATAVTGPERIALTAGIDAVLSSTPAP